ncbi:MAG: glycosyltransferase [Bacteroidales bacterium]|jgi:glycosyltransferase involved in cell wall biosynthesis|nr:glycosyltransferase [Bacteroidales bacterium]
MNKTSEYKFTVIVPFYNEEDNINNLEKKLFEFTENSAMSPAAVLFVDDGSRDNGPALVQKACGRHDNFFFISLVGNTGLSGALKAGIDNCYSEYLGYIDADLQTDPMDFNLLLKYAEDFPLVTGIRARRKDGYFKKLQSKIANGFRRMMTHDDAVDTGCPLKVLHSDYAKRMPMFTGMHRFIPALIQLQTGGRMKQIPVRHYPRTAGVSKYHLWNRLVSPFKDCFAYRWMKHRYINYGIGKSNL